MGIFACRHDAAVALLDRAWSCEISLFRLKLLVCLHLCLQARHDAAVALLDRAWSWEEVPPPWDVAGQAAWLKVGGQRPGHQAGYEHWLRKAQKEISK
jgi:hypothetical protein